MTDFVKNIIEKNIEAIENNKWEEFFYAWCVENADPKHEARYYEEITEIFQDLHFLVDYTRRIPAMEKYISEFIEEEKISSPGGFVSKNFLVKKASQLDIDEQEAIKIVEHAAKTLQLTEFTYYSTEGYTW